MAEQKILPNYLTEISSSSSFWSSIFTWHTFLLPLYTENTSIKSFKQTFIAIDGILSTLNHPYVNLKPFEATIDENRFSQAKVKIHKKKLSTQIFWCAKNDGLFHADFFLPLRQFEWHKNALNSSYQIDRCFQLYDTPIPNAVTSADNMKIKIIYLMPNNFIANTSI